MMKRLTSFYLKLWLSLRDEGGRAMDLSPLTCQRDGDRLSQYVINRGLRCFTLDLPALGSWFDHGLSTGRLVPSQLPFTRRKNRRTQIPRFMGEIVSRVFDNDGFLRHDADIAAVRTLRQLCFVGKKAGIKCDERKVLDAIENFYRTDSACPSPSSYWTEGRPLPEDASALSFCEPKPLLGIRDDLVLLDPHDSTRRLSAGPILHEYFDRISATLGPFKPEEWRPKHGPGAVSDSRGAVDKYLWPSWSEELNRVFPFDVFGFANYNDWASRDSSLTAMTQFPSKLIAVPKTQKGPRLIASEPTANQWCQQSIKDYFQTMTQRTWIGDFVSFADQTPNQRLALSGSLDGKIWTIDLSEASDRVSTYLVERAFRRNRSLLQALIATRTQYMIDPTRPKQMLRLRKFACMGSACTFPVQTVLYLGIALCAVSLARGWSVNHTLRKLRKADLPEVRIFGDDIIVPSDVGPYAVVLLHSLGFKVNTSKTHSGSSFRESCGVDAFRGQDVTPVYVMQVPQRGKPESIASSVETGKNLFRSGWVGAASIVWRTVEEEGIKLPTYDVDSDAFGKIGYEPDLSGFATRWNPDLHVLETRVPAVVSKNTRVATESGTALLQYFTELPSPTIKWKSGYNAETSVKVRRRWEVLGLRKQSRPLEHLVA